MHKKGLKFPTKRKLAGMCQKVLSAHQSSASLRTCNPHVDCRNLRLSLYVLLAEDEHAICGDLHTMASAYIRRRLRAYVVIWLCGDRSTTGGPNSLLCVWCCLSVFSTKKSIEHRNSNDKLSCVCCRVAMTQGNYKPWTSCGMRIDRHRYTSMIVFPRNIA